MRSDRRRAKKDEMGKRNPIRGRGWRSKTERSKNKPKERKGCLHTHTYSRKS